MTEKKQINFLSIVAAFFLIGFIFFVLKELQSVLLPFILAVIISFLFEPFYEWLKSKRLPSIVALIIVIITILIIANISSLFIFTSINSFTSQIPKYTEKTQNIVVNIQNTLNNWGFFNQYLKDSLDITKMINGERLAGFATYFFSTLIGFFSDFVLIMIYVIFLLSEFGSIRKRILKAFSSERSKQIAGTVSDIFKDVKKYVVGKTLINLIHGIVVTIFLWAFGVDFYIVWGFLTFLLAFIPNIGTILATILPFLTALIQFDGELTRPIIILILMIAAANVTGNIVEPKIFGDRLNLSPILLLLSLIFWGYVWGLMGMILSVPIMSMIKIIFAKFDQTRPISILMSYNVTGKDKIISPAK